VCHAVRDLPFQNTYMFAELQQYNIVVIGERCSDEKKLAQFGEETKKWATGQGEASARWRKTRKLLLASCDADAWLGSVPATHSCPASTPAGPASTSAPWPVARQPVRSFAQKGRGSKGAQARTRCSPRPPRLARPGANRSSGRWWVHGIMEPTARRRVRDCLTGSCRLINITCNDDH